MAVKRMVSLASRGNGRARFIFACVATLACTACGAGGDADGAPDFAAPPPSGGAGSSATNVNGQPQGSPSNPGGGANPGGANPGGANPGGANPGGGGAGSSTPTNQNTGAPVAGSNGSAGAMPVGVGGSTSNPGAAGAPGNPPVGPGTLPVPPGDAFFFDDFEAGTVGQAPSGWQYFVAWVANQNNPSGDASALIDDARVFAGTRAVHFVGGQNPAQITLPLPAGTSRLFVRAQVFMTRQLGQNPGANHETLIGIRGTPGNASNEVRFGEIKGVIGTNEVPTDNISPRQDQWGLGPALAANQWHCIEVSFIGDQPQHELHAYANGELVHSVTAPEQWNNGNLAGAWMAGKFQEVILGWHSFSGQNIDVWMDDVVLSTGPIGCD